MLQRKEGAEQLPEPVRPRAQHGDLLVPRPCLPGHHQLPRVLSGSTYTEKYAPLCDIVSIEFDGQLVPPTLKQRERKTDRERQGVGGGREGGMEGRREDENVRG